MSDEAPLSMESALATNVSIYGDYWSVQSTVCCLACSNSIRRRFIYADRTPSEQISNSDIAYVPCEPVKINTEQDDSEVRNDQPCACTYELDFRSLYPSIQAAMAQGPALVGNEGSAEASMMEYVD
jgi:hypothetical protein